MAKSIRIRLLALVLTCVSLFSLFSGTAFAVRAHTAEVVTPYYNNTLSARTTISISSTGELSVVNAYHGFQGVTTRAVITTYVEKKVLGLFWTRVDIGTTDDQWVDTINDYYYTGGHSIQLSSKGTYRVTVSFKIYGSGGTADEIECQETKTY